MHIQYKDGYDKITLSINPFRFSIKIDVDTIIRTRENIEVTVHARIKVLFVNIHSMRNKTL